jgi:hypothetical protein
VRSQWRSGAGSSRPRASGPTDGPARSACVRVLIEDRRRTRRRRMTCNAAGACRAGNGASWRPSTRSAASSTAPP